MAIETYFKNIADAIREKTGGSAVITPGNMPLEILSIAGGLEPLSPLHEHYQNGYINMGGYYVNYNPSYNSSIYQLSDNIKAVLVLVDFINKDNNALFRITAFPGDPATYSSNINNGLAYHNMSGFSKEYMVFCSNDIRSAFPYFFIYTGNNALNYKISAYDISDLF